MGLRPPRGRVSIRGLLVAMAFIAIASDWPLVVVCLPLALAACATAVIWLWAWPHERRLRAEAERYARWPCPNCREPFGPGVEWLISAKGEWDFDVRGEPFTPHVDIQCRHCGFLHSFDETGRPRFGRGFLPSYLRPDGGGVRWEEIEPDPPPPG